MRTWCAGKQRGNHKKIVSCEKMAINLPSVSRPLKYLWITVHRLFVHKMKPPVFTQSIGKPSNIIVLKIEQVNLLFCDVFTKLLDEKLTV